MAQNYKSIFLDAKNILHLERVSQVLGQYVQNEILYVDTYTRKIET